MEKAWTKMQAFEENFERISMKSDLNILQWSCMQRIFNTYSLLICLTFVLLMQEKNLCPDCSSEKVGMKVLQEYMYYQIICF